MLYLLPIIFALTPALIAVPVEKSPLDEGGETDYYEDDDLDFSTLQALQSLRDIPTELLSEFGNVPICQQKCTRKFHDILVVALQSPNHFERFGKVCDNFNETISCMTSSADLCMNQEPFDVLTSGLYYMCVEQRKAFEAVIECIDAQAQQIQQECEDQCHTKGKLANWAVQSGVLDSLIQNMATGGAAGRSDGFIPQSRGNPQFLRNVFQDGCSAGALLSEMFVRPIAETQKLLGFGTMSNVFHAFMPRQCDFMLNSEVLDEFRIDPNLDKALKSMYENSSSQVSENGLPPDVEQILDQIHNPDFDDYEDLQAPNNLNSIDNAHVPPHNADNGHQNEGNTPQDVQQENMDQNQGPSQDGAAQNNQHSSELEGGANSHTLNDPTNNQSPDYSPLEE
ncbi:chondroitin proteoglycan 4 domain-containing protein [Ditylenchus destructor]|nr:chondroitin proteoglycan 4 domain-containing protein [Ditylenchus destructor]